jgi:WD40 repeat protein
VLTKDLLVYGSINGDAVFVWLETGQVSRRPDIRVESRLAISLDGKTLATQSSWGIIQIWDLASVPLASPLNLHSGPVECVAPIADDNTILSSTSQEVKIWDISTGHCKETLQQVTFRYDKKFPLATATNAPMYATWSKDHIGIWHLDPTNGIKQLPQEYCNLTGLEDVAISANGERLAAILCDDAHAQYALKIWDVKNATLLQELYYNHDTKTIRFDGLRLAISPDGTRVVYNTPTTTELQDVSSPHSSAIQLLTRSSSEYQSPELAFHNNRIFVVTRAKHLHSFDHKTGEEIGRCILDEDIAWYKWDKSFINVQAIYGTSNQLEQPISDFTKPYYICKGEHWLHRKGDDILWLPSDYVPQSACVVGSTVVIGTVSGRVLFLYLRDQD